MGCRCAWLRSNGSSFSATTSLQRLLRRPQHTQQPAIVVGVSRNAERARQRDETVAIVELQRLVHLRDRLRVTAHEPEASRRVETGVEQTRADAETARVESQVHALQLAGERIRALERRDARAAHDLAADARDEEQRAPPLVG